MPNSALSRETRVRVTKDPEKRKAASRRWKARHPEQAKKSDRQSKLKRTYGITVDEYNQLLEFQERGCAICGKKPDDCARRLHVDHDHETDAVRGLLCSNCNTGLGVFKDSPVLLRKAIEYLAARG